MMEWSCFELILFVLEDAAAAGRAALVQLQPLAEAGLVEDVRADQLDDGYGGREAVEADGAGGLLHVLLKVYLLDERLHCLGDAVLLSPDEQVGQTHEQPGNEGSDQGVHIHQEIHVQVGQLLSQHGLVHLLWQPTLTDDIEHFCQSEENTEGGGQLPGPHRILISFFHHHEAHHEAHDHDMTHSKDNHPGQGGGEQFLGVGGEHVHNHIERKQHEYDDASSHNGVVLHSGLDNFITLNNISFSLSTLFRVYFQQQRFFVFFLPVLRKKHRLH